MKIHGFLAFVVLTALSIGTLYAQQTRRDPQTQRGQQAERGQQTQRSPQTRRSEQLEREIGETDDSQQELAEALAELEETHQNHIQILNDVLDKVPASARPKIQRAIENSTRGMERARLARQKAQSKARLGSNQQVGGRPDGVGQGGRPDGVGQSGRRGGKPSGVGKGGRGGRPDRVGQDPKGKGKPKR